MTTPESSANVADALLSSDKATTRVVPTNSEKLRIIFMGTPDFAVASLKSLIDDGQQVIAVVTAPEKPAGRGRAMRSSPVRDYALSAGITVLQPANLKDSDFTGQLQSLKPDLQVVVAFRMLPEVVWKTARIGTINLHASLLPQYRGAAPINWAIINGEKKTGVTTFFINHTIDTGEILMQEETGISPDDDAGTLHDRLKDLGARVLVETVHIITAEKYRTKAQEVYTDNSPLKQAPKINKEDCRIHWGSPVTVIQNFIRGLSPYPAAWSELNGEGRIVQVKIFRSETSHEMHSLTGGTIISDGRTTLKVASGGGFIVVKELQLAGKNRLEVGEFLKGFPNPEKYHLD